MSEAENDLAGALTDVRRAWRLVYAYQRRLNDLLAVVDARLVARKFGFEGWRPTWYSPPPRTGTPFFRAGTWAWDMLPGYRCYVEWTRATGSGGTQRVVIDASADSGFRKAGGEPDPGEFAPVEESESVLWIGLWTATTRTPDWGAAWTAISAKGVPPGEEAVATVGGVAYSFRSMPVYIEDLPEPADVEREVTGPILAWADPPTP